MSGESPSQKRPRISPSPFSPLTSSSLLAEILTFLPLSLIHTHIIYLSHQIYRDIQRILLNGHFFESRERRHFRRVIFGKLSHNETTRLIAPLRRGFPNYYHELIQIEQHMMQIPFWRDMWDNGLEALALRITKECDYSYESFRSICNISLDIMYPGSQRALLRVIQLPVIATDPVLMKRFIALNAFAFECADDRLRNDVSFVAEACKENPRVLMLLPPQLKVNRDIALNALAQTSLISVFGHCDESFCGDKEFVMKVLEYDVDAFFMLSREMQTQRDVLLHAMRNRTSANGILNTIAGVDPNSPLLSDREIILQSIIHSGVVNPFIPWEAIDLELIHEAIDKAVIEGWGPILDRFCDDHVVRMSAARSAPFFVHPEHPIWSDREVMMVCAEFGFCENISLASDEIRDDKEIAFNVLKRQPRMLRDLSTGIQNDRDLILAVARENGHILLSVNDRFLRDREIIMAAVTSCGDVLEHAPEFANDREIVLAAVRNGARSLEYASPELRNNFEIAYAAIEKKADSLASLSSQLKSHPELIALALTQSRMETVLNCLENVEFGEEPVDETVVHPPYPQHPDEVTPPERPLHLAQPYEPDTLFLYIFSFLPLGDVLRNLLILSRDVRASIKRRMMDGSFFAMREKPQYMDVLFGPQPSDSTADAETPNPRRKIPMAARTCGFPSLYYDMNVFEQLSAHVSFFHEIQKSEKLQRILSRTAQTMEYSYDTFIECFTTLSETHWLKNYETVRQVLRIPLFSSDWLIMLLLLVSSDSRYFAFAHENLRNQRWFILHAVKRAPLIIEMLSTEYRNDEEILLLVAGAENLLHAEEEEDAWGHAPEIAKTAVLPLASDALKTNREFITKVVKRDPAAIEALPSELVSDEDFMLSLVQEQPEVYAHLPMALQSRRNFIETAIQNGGQIISKIPDESLTRDVLLLAAKHDALVQGDLPYKFQQDRDLVLAMVEAHPLILEGATQFANDRDIVMTAVQKNGLTLECASMTQRNDRAVVLAAVTSSGYALEFASEKLQDDRELVEIALRQPKHTDGEHRALALHLLGERGPILQFASKRLQNDQEILGCAVEACICESMMSLFSLLEFLENGDDDDDMDF